MKLNTDAGWHSPSAVFSQTSWSLWEGRSKILVEVVDPQAMRKNLHQRSEKKKRSKLLSKEMKTWKSEAKSIYLTLFLSVFWFPPFEEFPDTFLKRDWDRTFEEHPFQYDSSHDDEATMSTPKFQAVPTWDTCGWRREWRSWRMHFFLFPTTPWLFQHWWIDNFFSSHEVPDDTIETKCMKNISRRNLQRHNRRQGLHHQKKHKNEKKFSDAFKFIRTHFSDCWFWTVPKNSTYLFHWVPARNRAA